MTIPDLSTAGSFSLAPGATAFMGLGDPSHAPSLNYSLPFSTTYSAVGFVELPIEQSAWISATPPARNPWADAKSTLDTYEALIDPATIPAGTPAWTARQIAAHDALAVEHHLVLNADSKLSAGNLRSSAGQLKTQAAFRVAQKETVGTIATSPISEVFQGDLAGEILSNDNQHNVQNRSVTNRNLAANMLRHKDANGYPYLPVETLRFSGRPEYLAIPKPDDAHINQHISLVFHYKFASFLGNYGAGQVLNTFSLLPGERSTITVRSYTSSEETRQQAESILDSYTKECADDLQDTVENETQMATNQSKSEVFQKTGSWNAGGGFSLNLGIFSIGGGGGGGGTSDDTSSVTDGMASQVNALTSSVSHHAAKADSSRNISVNTETTSKTTTTNEQTITRELENVNKSRALNFVFRQMLQEFITLTWLDDVSVVYNDGYPDNKITCKIGQMDQLLAKVLSVTGRTHVKSMILDILNNISDSTHQLKPFITASSPAVTYDAIGGHFHTTRYRKRHAGSTSEDWGSEASYGGGAITVDGIIVDVKSRVMRTPSVIVDSVLGQGNALDFYNTRLQQAAVDSAIIENARKLQAIEIIQGLGGPDKANLYKKVFGDCCDVPQSGCGCGSSGTGQGGTPTV